MLKTLSEEYRQILKETHSKGKWGNTGSGLFYKEVIEFIDSNGVKELLDYGAGWGGLKNSLKTDRPNVTVYEFEPARDEVAEPPEPRDFVVCTDVFEHVEPEYLDNFFLELQRVTQKKGFFTVCFQPAVRKLSDGRNAHLIVKPDRWWQAKVKEHFVIEDQRFGRNGGKFYVTKK